MHSSWTVNTVVMRWILWSSLQQLLSVTGIPSEKINTFILMNRPQKLIKSCTFLLVDPKQWWFHFLALIIYTKVHISILKESTIYMSAILRNKLRNWLPSSSHIHYLNEVRRKSPYMLGPTPTPHGQPFFGVLFILDHDYMCLETDFTHERKSFSSNFLNPQFFLLSLQLSWSWSESSIVEA